MRPRQRRAAFTAAALVVGLGMLVGAYGLYGRVRPPAPRALPVPSASVEALARQHPKLARLLDDPKVGSLVKDLIAAYEDGGEAAARRLAKERGLINAADELTLTILTETDDAAALEAEIVREKGRIVGHGDRELHVAIPLAVLEENRAAGRDPEELLRRISDLEGVRGIVPTEPTEAHQLFKKSTEGLKVIHGDLWQKAGFRGAGVKVGVLDPEISQAPTYVGTVLPANTTIYMGQCRAPSGVAVDGAGIHGSAAAEIIHEIAPDAQLFLACSIGDFEAAARWLKGQGVRVISHSAGAITGRRDGQGRQQKFIDQLAREGIVWVNSMGNEGARYHRGSLAGLPGKWHEFAPGKTAMRFVQNEEAEIRVTLYWEQAQKIPSDYDLYLFDGSMTEIVRSQNKNAILRQPTETVVARGIPGRSYFVGIYGNAGVAPATFTLDVRGAKTIEFSTLAGSISAPADAAGAIAVGAVDWDTDKLAPYSGCGPTDDGRTKPELGAPTSVSSTVYRGSFGGTSSSCPHVAGAAALLLGRQPTLTRDQVLGVLLARAKDLGPPGPDNQFGAGRLDLGDPAAPIAIGPVAVVAPPGAPPTPTRPALPPAPPPTSPPPGVDGRDDGPPFEIPWRSVAAVIGLAGTGAVVVLVGFVALVSAVFRPAHKRPAGWRAWLTVVVGPNIGVSLALPVHGRITLGRTLDNHLAIPDIGVSARHAYVDATREGCVLTDAGSTNGTRVNGARIQRHFLHPGDIVDLGSSKVRFEVRSIS